MTAAKCQECGAPTGRIHGYSCSRFPDVMFYGREVSPDTTGAVASDAVETVGDSGERAPDPVAASSDGKPVPVESLLDEDDFAVIREEESFTPTGSTERSGRMKQTAFFPIALGRLLLSRPSPKYLAWWIRWRLRGEW